MPGRTRKEALDPFLDAVQRAVLCVAQAQVVAGPSHAMIRPALARMGRERGLSLAIDLFYEAVPAADGSRRWRVVTTGYRYTLRDGEERELVSYQWHPRGPSPVTTPYLHLGNRLVRPGVPFGGVHLPTGFVTLAEERESVDLAIVADG